MTVPVDVDETVQDHRNLLNWSKTNETGGAQHHLPISMRFNDGHRLSISVYSVLLVFSAVANITVLVLLAKRRKKYPSRINMMLMHLCIADLLVTFLVMPLEIAWASTVQWRAGDAMCRIMMFFRTFGLFLSSFVLICISIDRFYAVLKPLHFGENRGRLMLVVAWMSACLCSLPQMAIFHVESHPNITWYLQCVTYNAFPSYAHELIYAIFGMILMYALPLIVIIYSYSSILLEIFRRTRNPLGADSITRSSLPFLGKAKFRTLKMTIIIVFVFFVCWTPYQVMSIWYWYDRDTALEVDQRIQRGLFLFACANSCMNPVVYGVFNIRRRKRPAISIEASTMARRGEFVCFVSWRKPPTRVTSQRRETCPSCGKSFQIPMGICENAT